MTPHLAIDMDERAAAIDTTKLNHDRLRNVRVQLIRFGYGAALLSDPLNIRYATGTRNMQVWTMHAPGRYVFVPVEGPVVLYEFAASLHVSEGFDTLDEIRASVSPFYFMAGPRRPEKSESWARGVIELGARTRWTKATAGNRSMRAVERPSPNRCWNRAVRCPGTTRAGADDQDP
jgi:Xaa-Pro aminopeptidase